MPERARELLGEVHADAPRVIAAVQGLIDSQKSTRKLVAGLIAAVLVAAVFIVLFVRQSGCNTDRTRALTGPGNERVTLFLGAFTASVTVRHLTPEQRAAALKVLSDSRERYPLIPTDAQLAKLPDAQIAGDSEAVRALDKNREYNAALKQHPVCTLWGI